MSSRGGQGDDLSLEPERVRDQLDRILSSAEFQVPERSRRFLAYVVDEALAGRSEKLKAYTIAQAVFGRDASFDAQNDPVVRIETGRIRRALERYYLVVGRSDPIHITIPKGGYVPSFTASHSEIASGRHSPGKDVGVQETPVAQQKRPLAYRDFILPVGVLLVIAAMGMLVLMRPLQELVASLNPSSGTPLPAGDEMRPQIVVEPLVGIGRDNGDAGIAKSLTDGVIVELTKVKSIAVRTPGPKALIAAPNQPSLSIQGSVGTEDKRLHVQIRLVDRADGAVVWTGAYDRNLDEGSILDVQDEIARLIADAISRRQ